MNTASTISQRDAYKLMLKDYPDVMSIEQMCEILSISTKTGYRILREGKICCLKAVSYTHLDVYKRQLPMWTSTSQILPLTTMSTRNT